MQMRKTLITCALLLALPMAAPAAEICETVNDVANGWNEVSNLIKETGGEGFTDAESKQIGEAVGNLTETTGVLAGLLQNGNEDQAALGGYLEGMLTGLAESSGDEGAEFVASVIDEVTSTLDKVTDDCDAHH